MINSSVTPSNTMYYISFLADTLLTEVWCNLTMFLTYQKVAKATGAKVITRHVFTKHHCGAMPANGVAKVAYCYVRPS